MDSPVNLLLNPNTEKYGQKVQRNDAKSSSGLRQRRHRNSDDSAEEGINQNERFKLDKQDEETERWRRILLLIVAITVHNIPEGLAVGVGFGAVGQSEKSTFENARNLAIGIGNFFLKLQHFIYKSRIFLVFLVKLYYGRFLLENRN